LLGKSKINKLLFMDCITNPASTLPQLHKAGQKMQRQKYGQRRQREPVFDFSKFLVSSSPEKPITTTIEDITAQLDEVRITEEIRHDQTLTPRDSNLPTHQKNDIKHSLRIKQSPDNTHLSRVARLLELSTDIRHRSSPENFSEWSNSLEVFFDIVKIAEASYGEVYRLVLKSDNSAFSSGDESVLKVLALKPPIENGGKKIPKSQMEKESFMSSVDNVVAEVKLLQRMADIPGFTNFRDVRVLKGRPSKAFAKAWKTFNARRAKGDKSMFPDPTKKTSYREDQLWAVIEMQDAGTDLERIQLRTVWTIWDVFWSVTLALAKGEQEADFEHRDLHMGNICIKTRKEDGKISPENARIRDIRRKLDFSGIESTIIDYTLSRAETMGTDTNAGPDVKSRVEFMDLATEDDLFEADATDEYQYEIYRYMRSAMYFSDPLADYTKRKDEISVIGRTWAGFHPQTNLVWLHFVLHELLKHVVWPSKSMKTTMEHVDLRDSEDQKMARKKAKELESSLKHLRRLLKIQSIPSDSITSARDLVAVALEEGWLDEIDIMGHMDNSFSSLL
jgi:serine/threonine-protein kinase haspin